MYRSQGLACGTGDDDHQPTQDDRSDAECSDKLHIEISRHYLNVFYERSAEITAPFGPTGPR